jgi:hypothetical protein
MRTTVKLAEAVIEDPNRRSRRAGLPSVDQSRLGRTTADRDLTDRN